VSAPPLRIEPLSRPPDTTVVVPGSKSLTVRAVLAAALADGTSRIEGALRADDTEAVVDAVRRLGVEVREEADGEELHVVGAGVGDGGQLPRGRADLDVRQSGATARMLLPVLGLGPGPYRLDGADQLRARPMGPGLDALRQLGVRVHEEGPPGHLPVVIDGGPAEGGTVRVPGDVSSQFLSGLLLAGPCLRRGVAVELTTELVSAPYVEMTRAVLRAFGVPVAPGALRLEPARLRATRYRVEPDASAASYFFAAAAITGGRVRVEGLGTASLQGDLRFVDVLERMGATVRRGEGWTEVVGPPVLHGVEVDMGELSDTAPTLAATAVFADSPTRVTGVGFIRAKESDRIGAVVEELRRCGIEADEEPDGFVVRPGPPRPARVRTYDDHRMAMSFALLGLRVPGIEIDDPGCVAKTFPGYFAALDRLRLRAAPGDGR